MREVKFRHYDKRDKVMTYQDKHNFSVRLRNSGKDGNEVYISTGIMIDNGFCPETNELMQYTGLKDKLGKEIYEGDIITYDYYNDFGQFGRIQQYTERVEFKQGRFTTHKFEGNVYNYHVDSVEIIGNIHENPELLGDTP